MAETGDMLRRGLTWLEQMRTSHCTTQVKYRLPPEVSPEVPSEVQHVRATYGRTAYEVADGSGLTVGSHVWDFLILADELGFEPNVGDLIVADSRRFEVMALGDDFRGWRWSDPYRTTYRIHTREIGPDDA